MNEKHKMFADEYLKNGCVASTAYKSCYHDVTEATARTQGSLLLINPNVKAYITEQLAALSQEKKITREYLVDELLLLINNCKTQGVDGSGTITDRANWNKAVQTLAKLLGFNSENVNHTGNVAVEYNLNFPGVEIKQKVKSSEYLDITDVQSEQLE